MPRAPYGKQARYSDLWNIPKLWVFKKTCILRIFFETLFLFSFIVFADINNGFPSCWAFVRDLNDLIASKSISNNGMRLLVINIISVSE